VRTIWAIKNDRSHGAAAVSGAIAHNHLRVLCRFFLFFFFRLCVAIFLSLRFLPQGTFDLLMDLSWWHEAAMQVRLAYEEALGIMHTGPRIVKAANQ
jgi:hypothetical protein